MHQDSGRAMHRHTIRIEEKVHQAIDGCWIERTGSMFIGDKKGPKHDTMDFRPIMEGTSSMMPLSIVAGRSHDSEANHEFVRKEPDAVSIMPARYEDVPVWRTCGRYGKQMKRRFYNQLYHQRNKNETINDKENVW